jgi:hypothetical protein
MREADGHGANVQKIVDALRRAITNVQALKIERKEVNADIAKERAAVEALGIPKAAFDVAVRYLEMDADRRIGFDLGVAMTREAGGLPIQLDLFDAVERLASEPVAERGGDDE